MSAESLFIRLSSLEGEPIHVNVNHISYMREGINGNTFVFLQNNQVIEVVESTDRVLQLMKFI